MQSKHSDNSNVLCMNEMYIYAYLGDYQTKEGFCFIFHFKFLNFLTVLNNCIEN